MNKIKKKIIYVLGLSHSGSTELGFRLSEETGGLAIGESFNVFNRRVNTDEGVDCVCSCGFGLNECVVWGKFLSLCKDRNLLKEEVNVEYLSMMYELFLSTLDSSDKIIIDTSKKTVMLPVLKLLKEKGIIDYKIIFLVRDVRGWSLSDKKSRARTNRKVFPIIYHMRAWRKGNLEIKNFLENTKEDFLITGYERFMFNYVVTRREIFNFLGLDIVKNKYGKSKHHIAYSNRMKTKRDSRDIEYNSEWMSKKTSTFFSFVYPGLMCLNNILVFGKKK